MLVVPLMSQTSVTLTRDVNDGDILIYSATDTLSSDTLLFEVPGLLDIKGYTYSVQLQADSVSGTAAATAYLQASNSYLQSGAIYSTIDSGSQTIDGAGTTNKVWHGDEWYEGRMRVRVAASGTCVNVIKVLICFKKP